MGRGEASAQAPSLVAIGTGSEINILTFDSSSAAHDGIGGGTEVVEVVEVTPTAEGGDRTASCGDLAIGRHGHVDDDPGTRASR